MKLSRVIILLAILVTSCTNNSGDRDVERAAIQYQDGNFDKAEEGFKRALGKELHTYSIQEVYTMLGNTYSELEQYDSSIRYHKKALQVDSTYVEALVNLGIVYRLTSKFDMAEQCYKKAQKINPEDPELLASLGALYVYKDEPELAIEHLKRSIELDPQLVVAHSNYALALAMVGEFDQAEKELATAVLMGYKNGDIIKERIDNLKEISE